MNLKCHDLITSFAEAKTKKDLPANKGSDERSTSDAQCPNSQRGTTVLWWIHLLHVGRAKRQRGTDAEALKNPSDHDGRV